MPLASSRFASYCVWLFFFFFSLFVFASCESITCIVGERCHSSFFLPLSLRSGPRTWKCSKVILFFSISFFFSRYFSLLFFLPTLWSWSVENNVRSLLSDAIYTENGIASRFSRARFFNTSLRSTHFVSSHFIFLFLPFFFASLFFFHNSLQLPTSISIENNSVAQMFQHEMHIFVSIQTETLILFCFYIFLLSNRKRNANENQEQ